MSKLETRCFSNLLSPKMNIYCAGWALQSPALNYFKKFIVANSIKISGIIYPKKIPDDLDGIPVIDFESANNIISINDIVLDCHRPGIDNARLSSEFKNFFASLGIKTISTGDFIRSVINQDEENSLIFPAPLVTSKDIKLISNQPNLNFISNSFADLCSYDTACKLTEIIKSADWDRLLSFDNDETPENTLLKIITEIKSYGLPHNFRIIDNPQIFLNILLKLKTLNPSAEINVSLSSDAIAAMGVRYDFYRRILGCTDVGSEGKDFIQLSGSLDSIVQKSDFPDTPAIFFMKRSIIDFYNIEKYMGQKKYRILLRQVDTMPSNLIAALIVN